ncbi:GyrI-like domain-containing protein [Hoeflea prorocentri]|uniref:GyrI-like domain-containing protein n=1 Tax=Hoeflea prorocentri TaxID=1922333 RepID=A0A9X3UH41_9HYPH|nr:GyrI-like domain-containing protein [Hoeflea prorocentri]MCY6381227.1 GyrI-like domain-containing protein [Hoeflea prorocentri]MDA5399027.1 GyrI-like domain-containing protein [Hoeflea prorocentri]
MEKIDFKKTMKTCFAPSAKDFSLIDVPPLQFLMIDGAGSPSQDASTEYAQALAALYPMAFKLKFLSKQKLGRDYVVPPLEALWWADDMSVFVSGDKDQWQWTVMIMQPDWITAEHVDEIRDKVAASDDLPALGKLRFETYHEGRAVQIMHIGPYSDEGPTLHRLHHEFLPQNGLAEDGHHHEIYLGDPRKTRPEKLKTVLRQPVRAV